MVKIMGYILIFAAVAIAVAIYFFDGKLAVYSMYKYFLGDHITTTLQTVIGDAAIYLVCWFLGCLGLAILATRSS